MQFCKSIIPWLSLSSCLGMTAPTAAGPLTSPKNERLAPRVSSINQTWLNESGRAEINLGKSTGKSLHGEVALLLPLQQDQQQLLFTQGNWRRSQGNSTWNIGVGQRWFSETGRYWGYNLFYDYRLQGHHQRLGLGVEQRNNMLSWSLNGYLPLSTKRGDEHQANTLRPARGIDLRLTYQPHQQPHWRYKLIGERYFGHTLAEGDQSLCHNRSTVSAGVDYTPWPLITAGYSCQLGSGRQRTHQWQLTLTYRLGMPLAQQLDPQQVAAAHSLAGSRLALVQRNHHILLEQQPNDTIRLELQPELRGKAGTLQTVTVRLHSARPRDEWALAWQGDLLTHTKAPQINGAADQATLILPNRPGIYTLQLQAHNARNQKGSSNQMRIIVEEWPAATNSGKKNSPAVPPVEPPVPIAGTASIAESEQLQFHDDSYSYSNKKVKKKWHTKLKNLEKQKKNSVSGEEKEKIEQEIQDCIKSLKRIKAHNSKKFTSSAAAVLNLGKKTEYFSIMTPRQ